MAGAFAIRPRTPSTIRRAGTLHAPNKAEYVVVKLCRVRSPFGSVTSTDRRMRRGLVALQVGTTGGSANSVSNSRAASSAFCKRPCLRVSASHSSEAWLRCNRLRWFLLRHLLLRLNVFTAWTNPC